MKLFVKKKHGAGYRRVAVEGELLSEKIYGRALFSHKSLEEDFDEWSITELETGSRVGSGVTIEMAHKTAKRNIKGAGKAKFLKMIADCIYQHGVANKLATVLTH